LAEELASWWQPGRYRVASIQIDLRIGGTYEIVMLDPSGARQRLFGTYLEIIPHERLVMTWQLEGSPADDDYEARLTLEFIQQTDNSTLMHLTHERLRPEGSEKFAAGWDSLLPKLEQHLEST
jgi:uncharacterized protein YndB with AHSA1/START domain